MTDFVTVPLFLLWWLRFKQMNGLREQGTNQRNENKLFL